MLFTLYGSHREMQKAADQGALAAAAGLPLLNPSQTLDSVGLNQNYDLVSGLGLDTALHSAHNIPDPRAVACAFAALNLQDDSARMVARFGNGAVAGSGSCAAHSSGLGGVNVVPLPVGGNEIQDCVGQVTSAVTNLANQLNVGLAGLLNTVLALGYTVADLVNGLVPALLRPIVVSALNLLGLSVSDVQNLINTVPQAIEQLDEIVNAVTNLQALAPALITPRVQVTVTDTVTPPLIGLIPGVGPVEMTVTATAERRLKNVLVLPGTPLIGTDLNQSLNASRDTVMQSVGAVNDQLNGIMTLLGNTGVPLGNCQNLLAPGSTLYGAIEDVYNPPASAPFTGMDLVQHSNEYVQGAAGRLPGTAGDLAGEAFLVIAQGGPSSTTLSGILGAGANQLGLGSLINLPIPALDVALVAAHHLENGNIQNDQLIPDTLSARGLFTAKLVQ